MFEDQISPRVYALPPGCNFSNEFVTGLLTRMQGKEPVDMARVQIYVNVRSLERDIVSKIIEGGNSFLPKISLITELAHHPALPYIAGPASPFKRRLELAQLVEALLHNDQRFAAYSTRYALASSLEALLDEIQGEGLNVDFIDKAEDYDMSAHWKQSTKFLGIVGQHWVQNAIPGLLGRLRLVVESLTQQWKNNPPENPIIVAGSTGSVGATQLFMRSVAHLPQGAIVLPCYDTDLPNTVWRNLDGKNSSTDHPQYRHKILIDRLGIEPDQVPLWQYQPDVNQSRNKLVSLALRPAPYTDHWLEEGPRLKNISSATKNITLINASTEREESVAIALIMRRAVENDQNAALVTPDRKLVRQVKVVLDKWSLKPTDSRGESYIHSVHGRYLTHIANMMGKKVTAVDLIILLQHPYTNSGGDRELHCQLTDSLNVHLRKSGIALVTRKLIRKWIVQLKEPVEEWMKWHLNMLDMIECIRPCPLFDMIDWHEDLAERIALGTSDQPTNLLWDQDNSACRHGKQIFQMIRREANDAGNVTPQDYAQLFFETIRNDHIYANKEQHPNIKIWNTEDARMQKPDIVIAGRLNEGSWPASLSPDPWINRQMRKKMGLSLPEGRIGLSANDFQQVVSVENVVLTQNQGSTIEPAVTSRWLTRLTGLLDGIGLKGKTALASMQERGDYWIKLAREMESPSRKIPSAKRPAPQPPIEARPRSLALTQVKTLITDPYVIYARNILQLNPIPHLNSGLKFWLRGNVLHRIMYKFISQFHDVSIEKQKDILDEIAKKEFNNIEEAEPFIKRLWLKSFLNISEEIAESELENRKNEIPDELEKKGSCYIEEIDFTLDARIDRLDLVNGTEATWNLYDYKSGDPPSLKSVQNYDMQLPLAALMVENGIFTEGEKGVVNEIGYIQIGNKFEKKNIKPKELSVNDFVMDAWLSFVTLIQEYNDEGKAYESRKVPDWIKYASDYDHLARYGEWEDYDKPEKGDVF